MKSFTQVLTVALLSLLLTSFVPALWAADPAPADPTVKDLISRGGYAYHVGAYATALKLAEDVLKLQPDNAAGLQLKQMAAEAIAKRAGMTWNELKEAQQERLLDEVRRQQVIDPADMDRLPEGLRRARPGDEGDLLGPARQITRENAAILARLEKTANVDFKDAPLAQVAQFFANLADVNVMVDPKAVIGDTPAAELPVTFSARNIKLINALNWVCRNTGLHYTVRDQVVLITTAKGLEPLKVTAVYDIADLIAPIPDFNSEVYFNFNLGAIDARAIYEWYRPYPYWYVQNYQPGFGAFPFGGAFPIWSDSVDRVRYSQTDIEDMIDNLIETEEAK